MHGDVRDVIPVKAPSVGAPNSESTHRNEEEDSDGAQEEATFPCAVASRLRKA